MPAPTVNTATIPQFLCHPTCISSDVPTNWKYNHNPLSTSDPQHPRNAAQTLMIKRELAKDPALAGENWDRWDGEGGEGGAARQGEWGNPGCAGDNSIERVAHPQCLTVYACPLPFCPMHAFGRHSWALCVCVCMCVCV